MIAEIIAAVCLMTGNYDPNMEKLLLETCAVESDMGQTSRNIMQMEEATRQDIITHWIRPNDPRWEKFLRDQPLSNKQFCVFTAKIHYLRTRVEIPDTRLERAKLWKSRYNTHLGKGTVADYMYKAQLHLGDEEKMTKAHLNLRRN